MVAKKIADIEALSASGYPAGYRERVLPRAVRKLGDAFGLTQMGLSQVTIHPGKESSLRHHHTHEDELIIMLVGRLVLHTNEGEEILEPGMCAGFRAGDGNGHHLINRSDEDAAYLVASNRHPSDGASYPDEDLSVRKDETGKYVYRRNDGTIAK